MTTALHLSSLFKVNLSICSGHTVNTADPVAPQSRMHLQEALAASEARFYSLVQNSPDGVVVSSSDGVILYVNPEAALMFGRSEERLTGKYFGYPIATDKAIEIEVLSPDKKPIVAEMRVAEIEWDGDSAYMCSIRDLSLRARLMDDLKRSNNDLNNFAEFVSQDIRAPLQNIGLLAAWLKDDHAAEMDQDAIDDVQLIIAETKRMQNMLEDLLSYSQVSAYQEMSTNVNLQQVLDDALEVLSLDILRSGANVEKCQLPTLQCHPGQMVSVFQHLLSNAINHCSREPAISIFCENKLDSWVIAIKDNGVGIDPKNWQNVFLPFSQLHLKEGRNSAGVGLATCKKIIERHGGKIWLKSNLSKGSTFYIEMPCINTA